MSTIRRARQRLHDAQRRLCATIASKFKPGATVHLIRGKRLTKLIVRRVDGENIFVFNPVTERAWRVHYWRLVEAKD